MEIEYHRATKRRRKDKGDGWWAYCTTPESLRPMLDGKIFLRKSLKTKDEREASDRLAEAEAHFYRQFEEADRENHPLVKVVNEIKNFPGMDQSYFDAIDTDYWFDEDLREISEEFTEKALVWKNEELVDQALASGDSVLDDLESLRRKFKEEFRKVLVAKENPKPKGCRFEDVAKEYFNSLNINPDSEGITRHKTKDEYVSKVRYFNEWRPNLFLTSFSKALATRYLEHLDKEGFAKDTIGKYITPIKNILSYAEKLDYITSNPWAETSAKGYGKRKIKRASFTLEELKEILRLPMRSDDYLLFVLCITTGARMDEMSLIRHSDVKVEQGTDVNYIDLTHVNALLKNESSKRPVPLLPEVRKIMPVDPDKGEARLFSYPLNEDNKTTPALSKRLNRKINQINDDNRFTFHSFRHTFRSRGRAFKQSDELIRFMMGHGARDPSEEYGDVHPLIVKLEAIQALGYKAIIPDREVDF